VSSRFDRDTAVQVAGDGAYDVRFDPGWWVARGPNGGYVAAIALRALQHAVGDPQRAARSLALHYLAPPAEGPARMETRVERAGRSLTSVSGRLVQGGRLLALALAAFSRPRESLSFADAVAPEASPPERCPALERRIPIHARYEQRWAIGTPPFAGGSRALAGGWIRLAEQPRVVDAPLLAAYADAWPPAVFSRLDAMLPAGIPTVDLTVHFRAPLPPAGACDDDFVLAVFRSRVAREGFLEEDGEIWSRQGELLAQSRQLALVL
jgi:acyl-CoA thioesterase